MNKKNKNNVFKIINVGGQKFRINATPELDLKLVHKVFPKGLPPGPPPYDIV